MDTNEKELAVTLLILTPEGRTPVLQARGEWVARTCPALAEALAHFLDDGARGDLVLDLSAVTAVDAEGLILLARVHHTLEERGDRLVVSRVSDEVARALAGTALVHFLRVDR